jgi:hypothetical protein
VGGRGSAGTGRREADPRLLGTAAGGRDTVAMRVTMSAPGDPSAGPPLLLPVVVAFLVADAAASPRDLLRSTVAARRAARPYPLPPPPDGAPPRRAERTVCWLLPVAAFDDDGWPGGTGNTPDERRTARLAAARAWLAGQGVAVVPV